MDSYFDQARADRKSRAERREQLLAEVRQKRRLELLERLGDHCRVSRHTDEAWVPWHLIVETVQKYG